MLEKTFKLFEDTMNMFEKEVSNLFKSKQKKKRTKIKIKAGSRVKINGVDVELINDTYLWTDQPDELMGKHVS